jgi:SHS2 domain-containing protein
MNTESKTVKLVSSDNEVFEVDTSIVSLSETIKNVLEGTDFHPLLTKVLKEVLFYRHGGYREHTLA